MLCSRSLDETGKAIGAPKYVNRRLTEHYFKRDTDATLELTVWRDLYGR